MFGWTVQPESKETNLGSSNLRDFSISRQDYQSSFSAMFIHGHASLQLFWGVWILLIPWVSFVMTDEFSVRITKLASRIDVS